MGFSANFSTDELFAALSDGDTVYTPSGGAASSPFPATIDYNVDDFSGLDAKYTVLEYPKHYAPAPKRGDAYTQNGVTYAFSKLLEDDGQALKVAVTVQ